MYPNQQTHGESSHLTRVTWVELADEDTLNAFLFWSRRMTACIAHVCWFEGSICRSRQGPVAWWWPVPCSTLPPWRGCLIVKLKLG